MLPTWSGPGERTPLPSSELWLLESLPARAQNRKYMSAIDLEIWQWQTGNVSAQVPDVLCSANSIQLVKPY